MQDGAQGREESWSDFRARCDAILDGLPLDRSAPVTVEALCAAIERRHGRRLRLSPLPPRAGATAGVCGVWVGLGDGLGPGLAALFPGLGPAMVRRLLARGRTDYTEVQERQAELLATLIHARSAVPAVHGGVSGRGGSAVIDRPARTLGPVRPR
ncbi:hypothetical protein [Streptomyces griseosporeus]|uniref:hypothetical protein n=1 Tax=Streptomyces griseosporeus TaxID=1910 RepID=UPI0036C1DE55